MKVFIEKENKTIEVAKSCTAEALLEELQINPNTVLLVKDNSVILADELLPEDAEVKILTVVSGG